MRDELDALIDDTARSMTEGAPRPALRAAVRARIAQPSRSLTGRLALAGVAAVLVIVAMTMTERDQPQQPPPAFVAAPPPPPPPLAPVLERVTPPAPVPQRRALARAVVPPGPIPPVDPVQIERVAIQPIVLEIVETPMPLRAERIEIEPLIIR